MIAYYGTRLSENIARTDEGYLICRNAVIARTGYQKYRGGELPADQLKALDYKIGDEEVVEVYRDPEEVFSPETIASFEGKPVTDDHPPGSEFVDVSNIERLQRGHIQNVRKGEEALENGDWPLLADVIITHPDLIYRVEKQGDRELSCGYNYNLGKDGKQLSQIEISGNHVAVVKRGRAGSEARINDAAPPESLQTTKEKKPVSNRLKHLLGLGLKALAADAETKPEELAEYAEEARSADARKGEDRRSDDARTRDNDTGNVSEAREGESRVTDRRGKDEEPDAERQRLHEALDRVYDAKKARDARRTEDEHAGDVDMEELKAVLDEYFDEEAEEEQHNQDSEVVEGEEERGMDDEEGGSEEEEEEYEEEEEGRADDRQAEDLEGYEAGGKFHPIRGSEGYKEGGGKKKGKKKGKKGRGKDEDSLFIEPSGGEHRDRQTDVERMLCALKPMVARSKDKALINTFNNIVSQVTSRGRASSDGYRNFVKGATGRDEKRIVEGARATDAEKARARAADSNFVAGQEQSEINNKMFEERRLKARGEEVKK